MRSTVPWWPDSSLSHPLAVTAAMEFCSRSSGPRAPEHRCIGRIRETTTRRRTRSSAIRGASGAPWLRHGTALVTGDCRTRGLRRKVGTLPTNRTGRDVYDLAQMANRPIDEPLVRRLWVLKVWGDVVDDRRGDGPLDPADVLTERRERTLGVDRHADAAGRPAGWERTVRHRYGFLADLDDSERRWVACDPRHRREVEAALAAGGFRRSNQDGLLAGRLTPPPARPPRKTRRIDAAVFWIRSHDALMPAIASSPPPAQLATYPKE